MKIISSLFVIVLLLMMNTSCDLKRNNPLDPSHPDIDEPPKVTGLTAVGSGPGIQNKFVTLTWAKNATASTDGYYIYRGLAYNAEYAKVDSIGNITEETTVTKIVPIVSPGFYYFKVSAYKQYPVGRLEGSLSEWAIARVDN